MVSVDNRLFIVFEGSDGCGKSTQLKLCEEWLTTQGYTCVTCRDPGTTDLGQQVRSLLLNHGDCKIGNRAEMLLFMVARAQLIEEVVAPALENGHVVLCDRYILSTVVYQGYAGQLEPDDIYQIGKTATNNTQPDLTLVFDLSVETTQDRVGADKDRVESRGVKYFEQVRLGFCQEAARFPETIKLIDASLTVEEIHGDVRAHVQTLLNGKRK